MAINFPDSPSVNDTHTASGVTWKWDGTTWKAEGVTSSYTLPTAAANVLGGVKVGTNLSINGSGVLSASGGEITVKNAGSSLATAATSLDFTGAGVTASGTGANKTINIPGGTNTTYGQQLTVANATPSSVQWDLVPSVGTADSITLTAGTNITFSGATADGVTVNATPTFDTRSTFTATTASLANNAAGNISVTAHKSYALLKIKPSIAAWVVLYVDDASRTADTNRAQGVDPAPDAGVIAEVVTTAANQEIKMSPGVLGWHQDGGNDGVDTVFCKVVNKSGSAGTCTVSLTVVQLEA